VQSVAVRLVVDREKEIEAFVPVESWKLAANCAHKDGQLTLDLAKYKDKRASLKTQDDMAEVLSELGLDVSTFSQEKNKLGNIVRK